MDVGSLASGLIAARMGEVQLAAAAKVLKMNADTESASKLIDAAQANADKLASAAAGIGTHLDITV